jgi:chitinase
MDMLRLFFGLVTAALLLNASASPTKAPKYRVIGYTMGRTDFSRISAEKLTHLNYAFGLINTNGEAFVRSNAPSHFAQLHALKARNPNLKVILSIGGWGADGFSDAALTDESRQKFARSCVTLTRLYALDGIDLDWEYPGQRGPGIKFRAEDKENFTALLKEVRGQLDTLSDARKCQGTDRYTLSIASAGGNYFAHTEMDKLHQYLDWINIMTYDFYGTFSGPGHHAALRSPGGKKSAEAYVKEHLAAGIPSHKLVVGAAFYSKSWTNVTSMKLPSEGKPARGYPYSALARDFINRNGFERLWDADARAAFLWNPNSKTWISYEDPEALREKCHFVKKHHLGGIMYWEHSEDPDEVLLGVLAKQLR